MREDMLVSVIIPVFNVFPFLREALDSVINQTYSYLEIIIVDDGSTDGSGAVCDEYNKADPRVKVVHQENKGVSNARNTGLDLMTGDMVAFLDPDDAFEPDFVEKMTFAMIQNHAEVALCRYTIHNTEEKLRRRDSDSLHPRIPAGIYDRADILSSLSDSFSEVNTAVWNKQFRRELWDGIRFPEGCIHEEWDVLYKTLDRSCKTIAMDLPLYLHRKRPGSLSVTVSWNTICDLFLASSRVESYIESIPDGFSEEVLQKYRQADLYRKIIIYARMDRLNDKIDKKAEKEKLRQQIIKFEEKIDISKCKLLTRAGYYMVRFYPRLFRIAYSAYYSAKLLVFQLTGKRK